MPLPAHYQIILEQLGSLPDSAIIPDPVVAIHEGVSPKTVKRYYPESK